MICAWCRRSIEGRRDRRFCSRLCRQAAFRIRRRQLAIVAADTSPTDPSATDRGPLRFAYADPPYVGLAKRYYSHQPDFAGEVDHEKLIASLVHGGYAGWALSCSAASLRYLLPLCPAEVRVCAWVKPKGIPPATCGLHNTWEPLLVLQGRRLRPGHADALVAHTARLGGSDLIGRKPLSFCAWLFDCLGMSPGDELVDLFPGSGVVGRAWSELSRGAGAEVSPVDVVDVSSVAGRCRRVAT